MRALLLGRVDSSAVLMTQQLTQFLHALVTEPGVDPLTFVSELHRTMLRLADDAAFYEVEYGNGVQGERLERIAAALGISKSKAFERYGHGPTALPLKMVMDREPS